GWGEGGIGGEDLAPRPRKWNFDGIIAIYLGSEVHHHQATLVRLASFSQPREYAALGIMHDQPLEPGIFAIQFVQGRYRPVKPIEIADQGLNARMPGFLSRCQSSEWAWRHSLSWPNSLPMNRSFLPGWPNMKPK